MKIFLVGMPGSGKTTSAKKIAKKFKLEFIDTDQHIESKYKMSISNIFGLIAEEGYRELEKRALSDLVMKDNFVMATGGGLPCFHDNMQLIKENGISIYLKVDEEELVRRIYNSKKRRPLTDVLNHEELLNYTKKTLETRERFYMQADHYFDNTKEAIISFVSEKIMV